MFPLLTISPTSQPASPLPGMGGERGGQVPEEQVRLRQLGCRGAEGPGRGDRGLL